MDLRLNIVPFSNIEKAFQASDETLDEQQEYNTHTHTLEEISHALPHLKHHVPSATQPFLPLKPWLDVIKSSQRLSDLDVHQIELPKSFTSQVLSASHVALIRGYISDCNAEDLAELFPRLTARRIEIEQLLREGKYFARLNTCSLKDAIVGKGPVRDSQDLWTRLATSSLGAMGMRAMRDSLPEQPVYLFLIRWNDKMRTDLNIQSFVVQEGGRLLLFRSTNGTHRGIMPERVSIAKEKSRKECLKALRLSIDRSWHIRR
ncbi:MAG: hypothetical protein L6R42_003182 [Xanthoria sp. 1 TBL-2021]|nr:MAG: hypothetical protein L6R42_003182 [Xanthoria sp. 1 TBL-2021]